MPGIDVPPAMMTEIKKAMTSTSEKILRLRSAHSEVFGELSADAQHAVKGIVWEMRSS